MEKRGHNILFHTHTVSGIVISVALYVIFFAGSFSFFRDAVTNWQLSHKVTVNDQLPLDLDRQLAQIALKHTLTGRDVELNHYYNVRNIGVSLGASKDSLARVEDQNAAFFYLDTDTGDTNTYMESYALGEFLYRLHFFAQIPYPIGYYLSGFTAFFFLFAIVTGILVHWKKIVSHFYVFRPWTKLKTLWTDAHTALGLIGFPFQFVYALTGAFFMINGIFTFPLELGLYDGDEAKMNADLGYAQAVYDSHGIPLENPFRIDPFLEQTRAEWPNFNITGVQLHNYGDTNMHLTLTGKLAPNVKFNGTGQRTYRFRDRKIVSETDPRTNNTYSAGVANTLLRIHLGDYAGTALRVISFLLGLVSCVVILSGVMVWLVARDKQNIPPKRRRFNYLVAKVYMAICLSMLPVTALEFILVKVAPRTTMEFIYTTYFCIWLAATLFFSLRHTIAFTNRWTLISGGILGLLVPLANGLHSGKWPWFWYAESYFDVLLIDVLWTILGAISLWVALFKLGKPNSASKRVMAGQRKLSQ
ncbi:MAG: PepSY-associated TM helix domain-containing protein [Bacteroidota bacterium]